MRTCFRPPSERSSPHSEKAPVKTGEDMSRTAKRVAKKSKGRSDWAKLLGRFRGTERQSQILTPQNLTA